MSKDTHTVGDEGLPQKRYRITKTFEHPPCRVRLSKDRTDWPKGANVYIRADDIEEVWE